MSKNFPEQKKHDSPETDDGMNKILKLCILGLFVYGGIQVIIALIEKFV
jgi:hypothetical protein